MERITGRKRDVVARMPEAHAALDAYLSAVPDDAMVNIEPYETPRQDGREHQFMLIVRVVSCAGCR